MFFVKFGNLVWGIQQGRMRFSVCYVKEVYNNKKNEKTEGDHVHSLVIFKSQ